MKVNFKRLLSCVLAVLMVVASFTFTAAAASYADVSTVSSAAISEIKTHEPLDYKVGEDIVFKYQIKSGTTVVTAPYIYYKAVMDDGRTLDGYVSQVDGVYTVTLEGGLLRPGFVWITASAADSSKSIISTVTSLSSGAGANVTEIIPTYAKPDAYREYGDLEAFWAETLAPLSTEEGKASIKFIYDCGDYTYSGVTYDCYELEINCPKDENYKDSWGGDNHVAAYLTIPQGKTNLGALLLYKGYDWISASGSHTSIVPQSGICNPDKITISVSPHSIPAPHNVAEADAASTWVSNGAYIGNYYEGSSGGYLYDTYGYTKNHGKNATENASPYTTYFKYMLMRDVQAVNFLELYFGSTPVAGYESWSGIWDGVNVKTYGSSQGGYQSLSVAGLCSDVVNEVYSGVTWFGDQGVSTADSDRYKPSNIRSGYGEGLHYVDPAHIATLLDPNCDVSMIIGLVDPHVPPATALSIYNSLSCNVTLDACQSQGHGPKTSTAPYYQTISKTTDNSEKSHTINYVSDFDASFKADFEDAWAKVCDDNVVSVDLYAVDKNTDVDFKALATSSTADAIGVILTGDGLTNINAKLAEIYALHNDVNSKVWVIENNNAIDGENAAITLDACMNWGDRPTTNGSIKLYTKDGELGQTSVLGANVDYAVIATPLWVSAQQILVDAENVTFENGKLSTSVDEASVTFSAPAYSATYNMTGVGDAADYGNIEGVGLWVVGNDGTLSIKGAGAIPAYDSYASTPWAGSTVTNVVVSDGITAIGANAFAISGATVNLPLSVAAIEAGAVSADATIVSYDNAYAKTFAAENSIKFTNLGATGSAGTDLTWLLDIDSGVLTISGTGTKTYSGSGGWSSDHSKEKLSVFYPYKDQIKTIKFCDSVTNIGSKTFYYIPGLTTVELTPNIKTIENNAFGNCEKLSTIYVKGNEPVAGTYDLSNVTSMSGGYQFDGSGKTVLKEVILSDNLTGGIGDKFISNNSSLQNITIPEGVTAFSYRTFNRCTALKEVTFLGNPTIPSNFLLNADEQVDKNDISKGYRTYIDTIYAKEGTSIQTWVDTANAKYEEIGVAHRVTFKALATEPDTPDVPDESDVVAKGEYQGVAWTVMSLDNNKYSVILDGSVTALPAASSDWGLDAYKANITKVVITAPITSLNKTVKDMFAAAEILELPTSCKAINGSALNDARNVHTVYTTGQEMVEGTFNLSNITSVASYALVRNMMDTIIVGENCNFSSNALFWQGKLSKVIISEGAKIGKMSFVSGTNNYPSDDRIWENTSVEFPASMAVIPAESFYGNNGTNDSSKFVNNVVVEITVKNPDAIFAIPANATADDYEGFVTWMGALETVKGSVGSTAETFVNWANEYFAENEIDRTITFKATDTVVDGMPIGDDLWYRILDNGDETYTLDIYGTGTTAYAADKDGNKVSMSWNFIDENRSFNEYASKITKIKISAPNVTKYQGYMFKGTNATHLELNTNITSIAGGSDFNGIAKLTTVYVTGNEPVEGVADFSNIKTFGQYAFVNHKFNKIVLSEELNTIPYWCFGSDDGEAVLEAVEIPASVTSIESLAFNNSKTLAYVDIAGDNVTIKSDAFNGCSAYATVIANTGSTAEAYAETMGLQFIDRANVNNIVAVYRNNNSVILLDKVDDKNVTAYATGSATDFSFGYTSWGNAVNGTYANRPWQDYKALITKVVFVNPALTKFDASFATHTALTTVEIPASTRTVGSNAFNGAALTTLYITGNEAKEGVVDLTNITALGDMCLASSKAHTILLNDDLSGGWGQNLFFQCKSLLYIRVPVGVTSFTGMVFNGSSKLNTVLFENKNTTISSDAFSGCTGLKTIIGYRGSTAETYANANGLEFIPLETESLLTFEGYEIREKDYNGLRSIFTANPAAMAALEAKGLKVVEYGSLLASTDKLNDAGVELTIAKNADGEYASHGFAVVSPIYQKGFRVGKILSESETAIKYACTVTYFNASNYTKNVTFRGYIVYEDKEGNDYVVYADLIGDDGEIYNSTNLEFVCQGMVDDGGDLSANISWLDVLKFRENLVK